MDTRLLIRLKPGAVDPAPGQPPTEDRITFAVAGTVSLHFLSRIIMHLSALAAMIGLMVLKHLGF